MKSIHVDELISAAAKERLAAAKERLAAAGWNDIRCQLRVRTRAERRLGVDVCALVGVMTIVV